MIEPNFSESQLQQLVNTEITMYLFSSTGKIYNAKIVSLIDEYGLGWDTAYYFPWLLTPKSSNQKGCNFFIQYKLSEKLENRGGQYSYWNCPYLRFHIPHHSKDETSGRYFDDYHQFDSMKTLSNQGFSAYYTTNHIVYADELFKLATNRNLMKTIPFLDVSEIQGHHSKVSFSPNSNYFLLHSDSFQINLFSWDGITERIREGQKTDLNYDVTILHETILNLVHQHLIPELVFTRLNRDENISDGMIGENHVVLKALRIANILRNYVNIYWYKVWL